MIGRRFALCLGLALAFGSGTSASAMSVKASPPAKRTVSAAGEALYQYEALVHQTFGSSISVCTGSGGCTQEWFYKGNLSPLSEYSVFTYVFDNFGPSIYHLMPAGFTVPGGFGNYPIPVKINGRLIACGPSDKTFLTSNGAAVGDGNLGCLTPS